MANMKLVKRKYPFSDSEMGEVARDILIAVAIDPAVFLAYGITEIYINNLRTQCEEFLSPPYDLYYLGMVRESTYTKEELAKKLIGDIRTIRTMAGNKWGQKNALYRCYDFDGLSGLSDEKLHRLGKRVIKLATQQMADLASEGLTPVFIADLQATNTAFDNAIDEQQESIIQRDIATQVRIELGNKLYKEIMKLARIGQDIYNNTNPARFKQFVIYHKSGGKKKKNEAEPPVA